MPNEQNLVPYQFDSSQSREEAAKNGALGGRASGASRRRKRSLREAADLYLSLPVAGKRAWNKLARDGVDPEDVDNQMSVVMGMAEAAKRGDARAAGVLLKMLGEEAPQEDPGADALENARKLLGGIDSAID